MAIKFFVAIWPDACGGYTAQTLDDEAVAAFSSTPAGAREQLRRCLEKMARREALAPHRFEAAEVREHVVEVRPEYREGAMSFPVDPPIQLRVWGVHARGKDDALYCLLPTLGLQFAYRDQDPFERLLGEAVRGALKGQTPSDLSRRLPPAKLEIVKLFVSEKPARRDAEDSTSCQLKRVADEWGRRGAGRWSGRALGREDLSASLAVRLLDESVSLLLVGEAGVGKSTMLFDAIRRAIDLAAKRKAARATTAEREKTPRFWRTSGQRLIAGMMYLGQWQERCELVIHELAQQSGVLCLEDLLEAVRVGGCDPASGVGAFLIPYLERGELRVVAEATPAQLDACRRLLPGLLEQFEIVRVPEFSSAAARQVLATLVADECRRGKIGFDDGVIDLMDRLFRRFQPYAAFPGRIAQFARRLIDDLSRDGRERLTARGVVERFQREAGLPERFLRDDLTLDPAATLDAFRAEVLGQEEACGVAARVALTLKAGLNDPHRPLAVLLFCGPTGVGKTELAKALARQLFGAGGDRGRLVRLDMSEYAGPDAAHRLLLGPDGEPSEFLQRVRRQPFCVVLFDEIEKASGEVHDMLLGLLDEGRLADRYGRVTTFQSAVVVMTSNVGAERTRPIGMGQRPSPNFERVVLEHFRPEFFNRLDEIVTFGRLAEETIRTLARRELQAIAARDGLIRTGDRLEWTERVEQWLAERGYDERYGARPLQRAVERELVAPLARWLLARSGAGAARLLLDIDAEDRLVIESASLEA